MCDELAIRAAREYKVDIVQYLEQAGMCLQYLEAWKHWE